MSHDSIKSKVSRHADMFELLAENSTSIEQMLRTQNWITADQRIEHLAPAGEGNMNRTLRVTLTTTSSNQASSLVLKQSVPFVARYPEIAAPIERCDTEADFYRAASADAMVAQLMPELIGFDAQTHLICFEDLGQAADFTSTYQNGKFTPEHRSNLMLWLNRLHGLNLSPEEWPNLHNPAMRKLNHQHIFQLPLQPDNGLDLNALTDGLGDLARELQRNKRVVETTHKLGRLYLAPCNDNSVLLHGDYYPGSWLRSTTESADNTVWVIDPEFGFFGPREFDLGVFVGHLCFASVSVPAIETALLEYEKITPFNRDLAFAFAGVEIMRRLLGVAQLPLNANLEQKESWLKRARQWLEDSARSSD